MSQSNTKEARIALARYVRQESDRAGRNGSTLALLHVEVDGVPPAGSPDAAFAVEAIVAAVRGRIAQRLRPYDLVTRLGPRTVAVVLSDIRGGPASVASLVGRLTDLANEPVHLERGSTQPRSRVGVALGHDRIPGPELIRRAAVAAARAATEGSPAYHDAETANQMRGLSDLREAFRDALRNDGISVAYQPVFEDGVDAPASVEALARWFRPDGTVPPSVFVPHAEESGLVCALGEAVMRRAAVEVAARDGLGLSVNVSPIQLRDPRFPALVEDILDKSGLPAGSLELEVTESVFVSEGDAAAARLAALRGIGVKVALDDFGTGYSGLGYLRTLPVDRIKVDRAFVADAGRESRAIVTAVVGLAKALGIEVTAEGVETVSQRDFLLSVGCTRMQGFLYGRPMRIEELDELLPGAATPRP